MNIEAAPLMSMTARSRLVAPIEATLQRLQAVAPVTAEAARRWLETVLDPLSTSAWPDMAWSFSRLTNTGMPIEFAWSSRDAAVRWTAEVDAPEIDNAQRLSQAASLLPWSIELQPWLRAQQNAKLKYGAWLGGRHNPDTATKLYVELDSGASFPGCDTHPLLRSSELLWRMAGLNADGSREYYARGPTLDLHQIDAMAQMVVSDSADFVALVKMLTSGHDLPRPSGISLVLASDGKPLAFTWFTFAKAIFRDDDAVSACLRSYATGDAANMYTALSSGAHDGRWRHGMIGAGIDARGATWLQCGLRPT